MHYVGVRQTNRLQFPWEFRWRLTKISLGISLGFREDFVGDLVEFRWENRGFILGFDSASVGSRGAEL